jgi:hypothetical protein
MRLGEAALVGVGMGAGVALAVCPAPAAPPSPTEAITPSSASSSGPAALPAPASSVPTPSPGPSPSTTPAPPTLPAPTTSPLPLPTASPPGTSPSTNTKHALGSKAPDGNATPSPSSTTKPALVFAPDTPLPPLSEARPALPPEPERAPVLWQHHIEVGGGVAVAEMLASVDGDNKSTSMRFKPGVGFHIDLSWQVWRYLRFTGYLVERGNALQLDPGVLGVPGTITPTSVHVYTFGVRFSPTLPLGPRARLWLTAGAGWGFFGYGRMAVEGEPSVQLPSRSATVFEIPLGLGAAFEIIPRWLSVHAEVMGSFMPSQIGEALEHSQYNGADHMSHDFLPMPRVDASFVETLGLSVHL